MVQPKTSIVAPRVCSPNTGDVIRLTDQIELLLGQENQVRIRLDGEGADQAICHLSASMPNQVSSGKLYLDAGDSLSLLEGDPVVSIYANPTRASLSTSAHVDDGYFDMNLRLENWQRDDFIEYLLAKHPQACSSVMARLEDANLRFATGSPAIWQLILDRMAASEAKSNIEEIVLDEIDLRLNDDSLGQAIADQLLFPSAPGEIGVIGHLPLENEPSPTLLYAAASELLTHGTIKQAFAMRRFVQLLGDPNNEYRDRLLVGRFSLRVLRKIAGHARINESLDQQIRDIFASNNRFSSANAASILAMSHQGWRPRGTGMRLYRAWFNDVQWPDVDLSGADLIKASFVNADLSGGNFRDSKLSLADFSNANLQEAHFQTSRTSPQAVPAEQVQAEEADTNSIAVQPEPEGENRLSSAARRKRKRAQRKQARRKKTRSNRKRDSEQSMHFHRAVFHGADLTRATLAQCTFYGCDFRSSVLRKVKATRSTFAQGSVQAADLSEGDFQDCLFEHLDLSDCKLDFADLSSCSFDQVSFEHLIADQVQFANSRFRRCVWTNSQLKDSDLRSAKLNRGRMADIQWENCDLRKADLRNCTFHMGSTRSGLVGSVYPSHGTRTGFYTDDYDDQHFQPPETIRKASLYGCDIRGANIEGVDFYLVDLRAAKFDRGQIKQLISTGAILDDDIH